MKKDICISLDMVMTGAIIKKAISKSGFSIREIQEKLSLSCPQPIYRWMKGQTMPSLDNLYMLSSLLDVHMEDLLMPTNNQMWILHINKNEDWAKRMKLYYKVVRSNG